MAILRLSIRSSKIDLTCFDKLKQVFRSNFQHQQIFSFFKKLIIYECFWFVLFLHWLLRQSWPNISSIFACICFQIRNCYHIISCLFFSVSKVYFLLYSTNGFTLLWHFLQSKSVNLVVGMSRYNFFRSDWFEHMISQNFFGQNSSWFSFFSKSVYDSVWNMFNSLFKLNQSFRNWLIVTVTGMVGVV